MAFPLKYADFFSFTEHKMKSLFRDHIIRFKMHGLTDLVIDGLKISNITELENKL